MGVGLSPDRGADRESSWPYHSHLDLFRSLLHLQVSCGHAQLAQKAPVMCISRPRTFLAGTSEASPRPWGARTSEPPAEPPPDRRPVLLSNAAERSPRPASFPSWQRR